MPTTSVVCELGCLGKSKRDLHEIPSRAMNEAGTTRRVSRSGPVPVLTPFKPGPGPVAGLDRLPHGRTGTRTAIDRTCVGPQSGLGPGPVRTVVAVQTGQNRFGLVLDQSSVTQTPGVRRAGQGAGADMPPGKQGSRQVRRQIVQRAAATRHQ